METLAYPIISIISIIIGFIAAWKIKGGELSRKNSEAIKREEDLNGLQNALEEQKSQLNDKGLELAKAQGRIELIDQKEKEIESLKEGLERKQEEIRVISTETAALKKEIENMKAKEEELKKIEERFTDSFKNLASEIIEEKGSVFTKQNKMNMDEILNPLQEKIKEFKEKVEKSHVESQKSYSSLEAQLKNLQEAEKAISEETQKLTKALKGEVKKQGNWGEMILERILETSGLKKDEEYKVQESMKDEEGQRQQPDVVIHLPENKHLIIDSKVSLVAYEAWANSEDEAEREGHASSIVKSIEAHYKGLAEKHYQGNKNMNTLDFVIMFMPLEPVLNIASSKKQDLFGDAYKRGVVLATPTTLMAILKTISYIWNQDKQNKNAQQIAEETGKMYDKLVGFVSNLEKVGEHIQKSQKSYDEAYKQLSEGRGNLIGRAEKIKAMGVSTTKELPKALIDNSQN